jgi:uncharacterized protein
MTLPVTGNDDGQLTRNRPSLTPLVIYLILFFIFWSLRATLFFSLDREFESTFSKAVYSNALKFIIWVLPAIIYLRRIEKRRPLEYLKLTTRVNSAGLMNAFLACLIFFVGVILLERLAYGKSFYLAQVPALAILSSSVSSLPEEMFFRGFVLNQLSERSNFRQANLIAAGLFTLVHWPNWLWVSGFHPGLAGTSLSILLLGDSAGIFDEMDKLFMAEYRGSYDK